MQVDLTQEEMNLIGSLFSQASLSMNRDSMIAYIRITDGIMQKFQAAITQTTNPEKENNNG